jgi:hypothetical protein
VLEILKAGGDCPSAVMEAFLECHTVGNAVAIALDIKLATRTSSSYPQLTR